jgi:hypothetical protein
MSSVVELYEALSTAPDDRTRARVIAEAFERLEDRYPHLPELATQGHVRESELRLQKEIAQIQANLKLEIEHMRADLRTTEQRLQKKSSRCGPNSNSISNVFAAMLRASRSTC